MADSGSTIGQVNSYVQGLMSELQKQFLTNFDVDEIKKKLVDKSDQDNILLSKYNIYYIYKPILYSIVIRRFICFFIISYS
jgi:hypothetical protein